MSSYTVSEHSINVFMAPFHVAKASLFLVIHVILQFNPADIFASQMGGTANLFSEPKKWFQQSVRTNWKHLETCQSTGVLCAGLSWDSLLSSANRYCRKI